MNTTLDEIIDKIRSAKRGNRACSLLIGAGCSVTAGIPTADGFVKLIAERFPSTHSRTEPKTYPSLMAALQDGYRRDLISEKVDQARINWAHIAIAQLMKHGYVDRILTTNFDPLVVRACALVGEFPAVYDLAASQNFRPDYLPTKAVFHLHGQRDGFVLLHTDEQVSAHSENLAPVFEDAGRNRMWLVVGYSGENDPVFRHLAKVPHYSYGLTWVRYENEDPPLHVRDSLLTSGKGANYLRNHGADRFFVELAQRLECFPPKFVGAPFGHLKDILDQLTAFSVPGQTTEMDIVHLARTRIDFAEEHAQKSINSRLEDVNISFASGRYEEVIELAGDPLIAGNPDLEEILSLSHYALGFRNSTRAESTTGDEAEGLYQLANKSYEAALRIKPDMHDALNNWGNSLTAQAKINTSADSDDLFRLGYEKYEFAIHLNPDSPKILYNWGVSLADQAAKKTGTIARCLLAKSCEKYNASLRIDPDKYEALTNWGNSLTNLARIAEDSECNELFSLAYEKYEAALRIKPDLNEALNNWGSALIFHSKRKTGAEADDLIRWASEKCEAALRIKSDMPGAWYNLACISSLRGDEGLTKQRLEFVISSKDNAVIREIVQDSDFDPMRDRPWFKALLESALAPA